MGLILSIDPGDRHVGMAMFRDRIPKPTCLWAAEVTPVECMLLVRDWVEDSVLDLIVVEEYRLYPWELDSQAWSDLPTARMIGAIQAIAWLWNEDRPVPIHMVPASAKDPMRAQLRPRKIELHYVKGPDGKRSGHADDAQLHGWHYLLNPDA